MPELPEVETVARDLRGLVLDATIAGAACHWARTLRTHDAATIGPALAGRQILSVGRRGKQVVLGLSGGAILTIHLKMTGQLFVVPAGAPADPYVRFVMALADGRELRFRDIRKFGKIGLYDLDPASGEAVHEIGGSAVFAGTGPEPLDERFTLGAFRRRLRGRRGRLKPLLLDQAFVAGIGNIYADEALWAARLHPLRSSATLRPPDERRLYEAIRRILAEAIERRGSSIDDYTAPDGDGSMQERLRVYQHTGEPCGRCGRPIRRIVIGGRATHFCSWCQRLPAADRGAALAILRGMTPPAGAAPRRAPGVPGAPGRRWTELDGEAALGRTPAEIATVIARARARAERTRCAAATRRAAARAAGTGGTA
ncbi:MAG: formamidopyrimidine-DNA glycosylase [Anaerolinea sp.]|nr:formamidopyrimidine-DNA glycosylase [Anaerolinea sp.]